MLTGNRVSDTQLGLLHGIAFGLFYAFLGIPLAHLADRWSRRGVILLGVGVWSLATAACGMSNSFIQLLLARIGVGAGEAGLAPAGYGIVTQVVPRKMMATAISIFQMGAILGAGLALILGGGIYAWALGQVGTLPWFLADLSAWQLTFIILALPGLPLVVLLAFVRDPTASRHDAINNASPRIGFLASVKMKWALYSLLFVGAGALVAISYGLISWTPTLFVREYGWDTKRVGLSLGTLMLTFAPAGTLIGGLLVDRFRASFGRKSFPIIMLMAAALTMPALAGLHFFQGSTPTLWLIALALFASSMPIGIGPAFTQVLAPEETKGRVSALYVLAVNLMGLGLGPVLIGVMSDTLFAGANSLRSAFLVFAILMASLGSLSLFLLVRKTPE